MARISGLLIRGKALFRKEPWWAEFWSAVTAMMWSAMAISDPRGLDVWPSMQVLLTIADDFFWDTAGLTLGAAQFTALLVDRRWFRWGAAIAMCCLWGMLTTGVAAATPWSPAVAVYAGWCGINLMSIFRLLRHHD